MPDRTRLTWARLNADTVLLILLCLHSGIFGLLNPRGDAVTRYVLEAFGDVHQTLHYVRVVALFGVGLMLLVALLWASVRLEVTARCLMCSVVLLNIWRHIHWLGWNHGETVAEVTVFTILVFITGLRFSVLLPRGRKVVILAPDAEPTNGGKR